MIKLIKIEQGKIFRLSEIVERVQKEFAGHSFLTLCFEEQDGTLAVVGGKDYVAPLTVEEIVFAIEDEPDRVVVNELNLIVWFGGLPRRFEHLLQIVRTVFIGRGFDEIKLFVPMRDDMILSLKCPPPHLRAILSNRIEDDKLMHHINKIPCELIPT